MRMQASTMDDNSHDDGSSTPSKSKASFRSSSSTTIPPEAVQWISKLLRAADGEIAPHQDNLCFYNVKDLQRIYKAMRSRFQFFKRRPALKRYIKADLVKSIRCSFYTDPKCTIVDPAALAELAADEQMIDTYSQLQSDKVAPTTASNSVVTQEPAASLPGGEPNHHVQSSPHANGPTSPFPAPHGLFQMSRQFPAPPDFTATATSAFSSRSPQARASPSPLASASPSGGRRDSRPSIPPMVSASPSGSKRGSRPSPSTFKPASPSGRRRASGSKAGSHRKRPLSTHSPKASPASTLQNTSSTNSSKAPPASIPHNTNAAFAAYSTAQNPTLQYSCAPSPPAHTSFHGRSPSFASPVLSFASLSNLSQNNSPFRPSAVNPSASFSAALPDNPFPSNLPQAHAFNPSSNLPTSLPNDPFASNLPQTHPPPSDVNPTNADPDITPQTALESKLMGQLLAMGFVDRKEILVSIRKLHDAQRRFSSGSVHSNGSTMSSLTCDAVMCDIVATRDEAEFARDMDQARLASERDRRKDAEERRKAQAAQQDEEMLNASVGEWLESKQMFKGSWLLLHTDLMKLVEAHVTEAESPLKKKLITLLKLEKQSRKWYGLSLPRPYFEDELACRLCTYEDAGELESVIESETELLNEGLALLSNQQGMVPRIFAQAYDAAMQRKGENGSAHGDDDDDDEVIVLGTRMPSSFCAPSKDRCLSDDGATEAIEIG